MTSGSALYLGESIVERPGWTVRPVVRESVEEIRRRHDACLESDGLAGDPIGIPRAIPPFVMAACDAL